MPRIRILVLLLGSLAGVLLALPAAANVRMVELDEANTEVTLRNFSASATIDVSDYFLCRAPGTYRRLSTLTIVGSGDLDLSPGEEVTVVYTFIEPTGGIGLYFNNAGFSNPVNLADYVQYAGVSGFREPIAVSAGLWTAGTFASGTPGPWSYTGDGSQDGAAFWTNSPGTPVVPALPLWGAVVLTAILGVSALSRLRRA